MCSVVFIKNPNTQSDGRLPIYFVYYDLGATTTCVCPFSPLKSVRDGIIPKQTTHFGLHLVAEIMHELVQTKNNGGEQLNAVFKYYFQAPFDWAFSDNTVHWQESCYCDSHHSHLPPIRM